MSKILLITKAEILQRINDIRSGKDERYRGLSGEIYFLDIGLMYLFRELGYNHNDVKEISGIAFDVMTGHDIQEFDVMFDMGRNIKNVSIYRYLLRVVYYGYFSDRMNDCSKFLSKIEFPVSTAFGTSTYKIFLMLMRGSEDDMNDAINATEDSYMKSNTDYIKNLVDIGIDSKQSMWNTAFFMIDDILSMLVRREHVTSKKIQKRASTMFNSVNEKFVKHHGLHGMYIEPLFMLDVIKNILTNK